MSTKYQDKFGHPIERTKGKVRPFMAVWIQDFIRHSPFCVMATSNENGDCDASPKGGTPGFVKVLNERQLYIPDVAGNKLFHGYGNIESNQKAEVLQGLLVEVDESYSHCPRALTFSRLWNIDEISKNIAEPPVGVKESGI